MIMRQSLTRCLCCAAAVTVTSVAAGEELRLFQASQAGVEAWVWSTARIKPQEDRFVVREHNPEGDYGDTFVANRFPYVPEATVAIAVDRVISGDYTLQVLGFKTNVHTATVKLVEAATEPGRKTFRLKDTGLPADLDEIMLKLWVGGAPGASTVLADVTLSLPLDRYKVLLDESFQALDAWEKDNVTVKKDGQGLVIGIPSGVTFGSLLMPHRIPAGGKRLLLWHIPRLDSGDASLQIVLFDPQGTYADSVDALKNVRAGWHGRWLPLPGWPAGAASFQIKVWVGGNPSLAVRPGRLLVLEPTP